MKAFRDVEDQERFFRRMQADKYTHLYTATFLVPYPVLTNPPFPEKRSAIMQVEEDADFLITHMIGSVIEPVLVSTGVRTDTPLQPTFPMAGTTRGRTDRGLDFHIVDPASGRPLTLAQNSRNITLEGDYIPFAAVFTPGYAFKLAAPIPFEYYIERKRRLILNVRNRSTLNDESPSSFAARVTFGFLGHRVNA